MCTHTLLKIVANALFPPVALMFDQNYSGQLSEEITDISEERGVLHGAATLLVLAHNR